MDNNLGILGVGVYLPPIIRKNDFWPQRTVDEWKANKAQGLTRAQAQPEDPLSDGMRVTLQAMAEYRHDPFEGAVERRVMPDDMLTSEMEMHAAREAIAQSGIDPGAIDLVIAQSTGPNYLHVSNACLLHQQLGLNPSAFSIATDGMCNSFQQQLVIAEGLIRSGRMRYGLLIQSSNMTHFIPPHEPFSPWFGDGAAATVVGPVAGDRGLLGHAHCTDGSVHAAIVTGVPGKRWWEEGRVIGYLADPAAARRQFLIIAESSRPLFERALAESHLSREDVAVWACHQASAWLPIATQRYLGLDAAYCGLTFPFAASISGANLPLVLKIAEREGRLHDGDVVAMLSGAAGMQVTASLLRWGR
jgi:3-oxoacyl-[acyl-carrier-protein] synthase-3